MGKLGILVSSDKNQEHIVGLTKAAIAKGHKVQLFYTGPGTKLAPDSKELIDSGAELTMCEKTYTGLDINKEHGEKLEGVEHGSQDNNAEMIETSDKYVVM